MLHRGARAALVAVVVLTLIVGNPAGSAIPASAAPSAAPVTFAAAIAGPATAAALHAVIERANAAQQRAFATGDPTVMRATATGAYYQQLVQTNRALASGGVAAIELRAIEWGSTTVDGDQAQVTAHETWRTVYTDGTTEQARELNLYSLIAQGDTWLIQENSHPDLADTRPSAPPVRPAPPASDGTPSRPVAAGAGQSQNWSGYAAAGQGFTGVTGTWTVPPAETTSTSFGSDGTWVGIGGLRSHDLIQAGTATTVSGTGRARFEAWIELLPAPPRTVPLPVKPGDSVTVSIAEQSADQWLVTLTNNTTGQTYRSNEQYSSSGSSVEWIQEAPTGRQGVLPLSNFGTVTFTGGTAARDGQILSIAQTGARAMTMIDRRGQPIAVPTSLDADGSGFSVTRAADSTAQAAVPAVTRPAPAQPPLVRPGRGPRSARRG